MPRLAPPRSLRIAPVLLILAACGAKQNQAADEFNTEKQADDPSYIENTVPAPDVLQTVNESAPGNNAVVEVYPPGDAETAPDK